MRYGFTRSVARIHIALGVVIMCVGVVLAIAVYYAAANYPELLGRPPLAGGRQDIVTGVAAAAAVFVGGFLIGVALIVCGQLILAFLDMRARLVRIDRRLSHQEDLSTERESSASERLRPR